LGSAVRAQVGERVRIDDRHAKFTGFLRVRSSKTIADILIQGNAIGGAVLGEGHWWKDKNRGKEGRVLNIVRVETANENRANTTKGKAEARMPRCAVT
jgi:hypothetical protein